MGAIWGDYDNDGYEDLFVNKWGRPELFHNDGGRGFTRVTDKIGLPAGPTPIRRSGLTMTARRLDLFVGGYYAENVDLWHLTTTKIMPESFEYAQNGGRKYLSTISVTAHLKKWPSRSASTAAAGRWLRSPQTCAAPAIPTCSSQNDYGVSELFFNDGGKRFREVGKATGVALRQKRYERGGGRHTEPGQVAIYVTNISEERRAHQGNNLWVPNDGATAENIKYENLARDMGVELAAGVSACSSAT